jgi:CheY-like chemotaxis protein/HPt (histidine-containing phosphotransfer) domain-containing protein
MGDPTRLRQILVNLAGNAIKFTETGEVVLRVSLEETRDNYAHVRFEVSDTGIGIPENKRELIFEAFSQADSSTTRRYGGTGLGLAISSDLVRLMEGHISLESEIGKGSTFHFTIPLPLVKGHSAGSAESNANLEGVRVLAVDDNATNRQILREVLKSWHMSPTVVESAADAVNTMKVAAKQKAPFSLAILDGHMPGTDGFTLAMKLKRNPALSKTRIIMLTSALDRTDAERCRKISIAAHLNKPVKQSALLDTIEQVLAPRKSAKNLKKKVRRAPAAMRGERLRILVAEDNPVNQKLMTELLERRGCKITLASNGKQAIDAMAKGQFDLVLMDIQMSVMGGLDATTAIRKDESRSGKRTPIVGISAHAMASDRARAIEAGMDAYIVKPIRPAELYQTIDRLTGRPSSAQLDEQTLLDGVGGRRQLLKQLIAIFLKDSPRMIKEIRNAVESRNNEAVSASAHALKGASANFGPNAVCDTAKQLENIGKTGAMDAAPGVFKNLEQDLIILQKELRRLAKGGRRTNQALTAGSS